MDNTTAKINKKTLIIISVAIGTILCIAAIVFAIISAVRSATLEILVAPASAEITIDGRTYQNGTYSFAPGEYTAIITKPDFVAQEITFTLTANETTKLYTYLLQTDSTYSWYLEHNEDALILNTIGDAEAIQKAANFLEKYPISNILPLIYAKYSDDYSTYTEFRVDGGSYDDCSAEFCLKITDQTGNSRQIALDLIKSKGYNPDNYQIIYQYDPIIPL